MHKKITAALFALSLAISAPALAQTVEAEDKGTAQPPPAVVPTMTDYGLILLALSLAGVAYFRLRRSA